MTDISINENYSITDARKDLATICERLCENHSTVLLTRAGKNKGDVVMMSADDFNSLQETLYLMSSPENHKRLMQSIDNIKQGKDLLPDPRKK